MQLKGQLFIYAVSGAIAKKGAFKRRYRFQREQLRHRRLAPTKDTSTKKVSNSEETHKDRNIVHRRRYPLPDIHVLWVNTHTKDAASRVQHSHYYEYLPGRYFCIFYSIGHATLQAMDGFTYQSRFTGHFSRRKRGLHKMDKGSAYTSPRATLFNLLTSTCSKWQLPPALEFQRGAEIKVVNAPPDAFAIFAARPAL